MFRLGLRMAMAMRQRRSKFKLFEWQSRLYSQHWISKSIPRCMEKSVPSQKMQQKTSAIVDIILYPSTLQRVDPFKSKPLRFSR